MTIVELRRYTLRPGRRDELIELFVREFVESQEVLGARIVGMFRDARDADRFVWIRAFADMAVRQFALQEFYGGPVWRAHGPAANATMIDSDDVHLLELESGSFVTAAGNERVVAVVAPTGVTLPELPAPIVALRTSTHENDFPALPVHTHPVHVRIASVPRTTTIAADGAEVWELLPTTRSRYR